MAANTTSKWVDVGPPPNDIVIPPKNVREDIANLADYVYRRGDAFEDGVRTRLENQIKNGESNIRLTFVQNSDPYHPYYEWYKMQLKQGKGQTSVSNGAQGSRNNKPKGPQEPAKFRFSARMPNISAKDLEILRLTALYTARVGENWLKDLRNREQGNPQFQFLHPTHSFFQFFRSVVEQYKILLEEDSTVEGRIEELGHNIKNKFHVLDRARERAEYTKYVKKQKEKEEKKVEDEKKEFASIDWHNFSIIATIIFDENDDAAELPPPTLLNDLQSASLEQKAEVSLSRRLEETAPDEVGYYNVSQQAYPAAAPAVQPAYGVPPGMHDYRTPAQRAAEADEARIAQERQAEQNRKAQAQAAARGAPGSMRIVTDYDPRARAKKINKPMSICPNCKQSLPSDEMPEHMRIEMLDPRWKEQRDKSDARHATTIHTAEVANNLKRFASQREDIYDDTRPIKMSAEEQARRKKAAEAYDGQLDPAKDPARVQQMQSMNIQEQLRGIQERHGGQ